jgi:hypothetical protein
MFGNIGGLISTWSFLAKDTPNFPIGKGLNLATSTTILIASVALLLWMLADNRRREKRNHEEVDAQLGGLSEAQIQNLDWRHPGFRWHP